MNIPSIHFVCSGNIYRSRLAEAYTNHTWGSLVRASSSGIAADTQDELHISPYAEYAAVTNGYVNRLSATRQQTTNALLATADLIVFLDPAVHRKALETYDFHPAKAIVWSVEDMGIRLGSMDLSTLKEDEKQAEALFAASQIKQNVDTLLDTLKTANWKDVVDSDNTPLGFRLPRFLIQSTASWTRGCHAIITTPDGKFVIQKRAHEIVFAPDKLDVSVGGGVDAGESPEEAIVREIHEELGVHVHPSRLRLLEIARWHSYHPRYKQHSRIFLYTYHAILDETRPKFIVQTSEVSEATLISKHRLTLLLRTHWLRGHGALNPAYAYYKRVIRLALGHLK